MQQSHVDRNFVYPIKNNYHFVPSVQELYWTELDFFDRDKIKYFIQHLLERIHHCKDLPEYQYVLFDCPPSFSVLSYSVLSCCDLVLIPINPDFFAAKGLQILISSLKMRIHLFPVPRVGVVMNRAKTPGGSSYKRYSNETQRYLDDSAEVLNTLSRDEGIKTRIFDTTIPDRVAIKRAIQQGLTPDMQPYFRNLWLELASFLQEK